MMRSAVLTQITRVTDGQTDRRTDRQTDRQTDGTGVAYTRYSINAVARKNRKTTFCKFLSWRTDGQEMARFHRETKKKKQCL